jgi:prevent-host-death family protein
MVEMNVTEAREEFADMVNRVAYRGERIVIQRKGRKMAVMVPIADLELLEKIENKIDRKLIKEALKERAKAIPYEKVRKELGLNRT